MTPYYADDAVQLFLGDCREILPTLDAGSIDLVLTDPPYGIAYSTGYRQAVSRSSTRLAYDLATSPLLHDTAALMVPLLHDTAALYVFAAPSRLDVVLPILRAHWDVPNVLCWDKGNCTAGDLDTTYGQQWEAVLYARTARTALIGGRDRDVLRFPRGSTVDYCHPTQKPTFLLRYLIGRHASTCVLDPFAGSGSTLVAAKESGRRAIGIEIVEKYAEIAARRLSQDVLALTSATR